MFVVFIIFVSLFKMSDYGDYVLGALTVAACLFIVIPFQRLLGDEEPSIRDATTERVLSNQQAEIAERKQNNMTESGLRRRQRRRSIENERLQASQHSSTNTRERR